MLENTYGIGDYLLFISGLMLTGFALSLLVWRLSQPETQTLSPKVHPLHRYGSWLAVAVGLVGVNHWGILAGMLNPAINLELIHTVLEGVGFAALLGYLLLSYGFKRSWPLLGAVSAAAISFIGIDLFSAQHLSVLHIVHSLLWIIVGVFLTGLGRRGKNMPESFIVQLLGYCLILFAIAMAIYDSRYFIGQLLRGRDNLGRSYILMAGVGTSSVMLMLLWGYMESFTVRMARFSRRFAIAAVSALLLTCVLVGGLFLSDYAGDQQVRHMRDSLLYQVTVGSNMEIFKIKSLSATQKDLFSSNYAALKHRLLHMAQTSSEFSRMYLLAMSDGEVLYLVDSESAGSENYAAPGTRYHLPSEGIIRCFTGKAADVMAIENSDGQRYVCAVAAVVAESGNVVAVLGGELPLAKWQRAIVRERIEMIGAIWGISIVIIGAYVASTWILHSAGQLEMSQSMYRNIVEAAPNCVSLCGADGKFLAINGLKAEQFSQGADLVGQNYAGVWTGISEKNVRDAIAKIKRDNEVTFEAEKLDADGNSQWWQVSLSQIKNKEGNYDGFVAVATDITEHRSAQRERDQLRRQIEFVLAATGTRLNIVDAKYNLRYVDPEWCKIYGDYTGKKCYEYFSKTATACDNCAVADAVEHGKISITQKRLEGENNRPIEVTTIPFLSDDDEWLVAEVNVDISDRIQQQAQRRSNDALTKALLQLSQMANESEDDLYDYALSSAIGLSDSEVGYIALVNEQQDMLNLKYCSCDLSEDSKDCHGEYKLSDIGLWGDALRQRTPVINNHYNESEQQREIDFPGDCAASHTHMGLPVFEGDNVVAIAGLMGKPGEYSQQDINQVTLLMDAMWKLIVRLRAEAAATNARDFYLTLFDTFPALIWRSGVNGKLDYVNKTWQSFTGRSLEQEIGDGWLESLHEDDVNHCQQIYADALENFESFELECRLKRHDGEYRWILNCGRPFDDLDGNFAGFLGTCYDITERKRMEESLMRIRAAVDDSTDAIVITDESGKVIYANTAFVYIFDDHWETVDPKDLFVDPKTAERVFMEIHAGVSWKGEVSMKARGGRIFSALVRGTAILDDELRVIGEMLLIDDMTDNKRMESELRQSQKLTAVGQLASGIAHEINTPMQYVGDNTRFLQDSFEGLLEVIDQYRRLVDAADGIEPVDLLVKEVKNSEQEADVEFLYEEIPQAITQSLEGIERVTKIVRAMRDMAHPGKSEKTATDLNRLIESTITVSRNEWKYVSDLELELDDSLPMVPCLPGEFSQVILNLIVNASHAISDKFEEGSESKGKIVISTHLDGDYVEIRIADNGGGIPDSVIPRIFEPFFTTKEVGRGTGQGLTISRNVVMEKHGGTLEFETEHGVGTTFIVRLPLKASQGSLGEFDDTNIMH